MIEQEDTRDFGRGLHINKNKRRLTYEVPYLHSSFDPYSYKINEQKSLLLF